MSPKLLSKIKILAVISALVAFAPGDARAAPAVETYADQAVPVAPPQSSLYDSPLRAGQMTLEDVLIAHPPAPSPSLNAPISPPPPPVSRSVPLLSNKSSSTASVMLMQGLNTALQENGGAGGSQLKPPQMQSGNPVLPLPPVAEGSETIPAASVPGMTYQPGQAPVDLTTAMPEVAPALPPVEPAVPIEVPAVSAPPQTPTPPPVAAEETKAPSSKMAGHCEPHVSSWTKTCIEAGYPESFSGKITGETRTVCPDGSLEDVWIANSCAPPEETESDSSFAPPGVTATAAPAATEATSSLPPMAATPPPSPQPYIPAPPVRADAACGSANGLAADAKPITDLCVSGDATEVLGDGPWRWSCKGTNGGMTVSCAAVVAATSTPAATSAKSEKPTNNISAAIVEDGVCGSADGAGVDHAPASTLCAKGTTSRVNGNGPWTWACSGSNGGQAAACNAPKKTNGICGTSASMGADQMPTSDLCVAGYASAVTGNGPWNWTCSGLYGGSPATCTAAAKKDAVCGSASTSGHKETPKDDLCSVGKASAVHGNGPWSWACNGEDGGSSVSCTAAASVSGVCGGANGVAVTSMPSEELCAHGTPTRVTGLGPWLWNCSGADGGETQSCTAPLGSKPQQVSEPAATLPPAATPTAASSEQQYSNLCGTASELMALEAPEKELCSSSTASSVSGTGPWSWTCSDSEGHTASCATLSPAAPTTSFSEAVAKAKHTQPNKMTPPPMAAEEAAACGFASGQGSSQSPSDGLCSVGKASTVRGTGPWTWSCYKDKNKIACQAPKLVDASCGPANGSIQKYAPNRGLCASGTPTDIQGNGPWLWSCVGTGGGASISCSATSEAQTRVDGSCGAAANTPMTSRPEINLCDSGVQSAVYGEGPWTWTCSGLNSGIAVSCSSQKNVPPAPPPPGPSVNGLCGPANGAAMIVQPIDDLCTAGTATAVSGNGPWNWNCLGQNSGMTVSCTSPMQPPAPITGVCGSVNGLPTLTTPKSGLCAAGISSAVSGRGPWTWSCSGTNGGGAVGCVAPLASAGGTGSLPSVTTPDGEAPAPKAAPMPAVTGGGLVTPRLPSGPLPPLNTGTLPSLTPSKAFESPPEPSALPPVPAPNEEGMMAPSTAPDLPAGTTGIQPPPIRDTLAPSPALKPPAIDKQGNLIPGNHFTLDEDISTVSFVHGSENISPEVLPILDKLVTVLQANSGVRITLTAYADVKDSTPRDARRMSLSRALAMRDYLTSKGISSSRVDVRALGANVSSGEPDRIDIKAN